MVFRRAASTAKLPATSLEPKYSDFMWSTPASCRVVQGRHVDMESGQPQDTLRYENHVRFSFRVQLEEL